MKKKISILLAVMMVLSLLPVGVYAAANNTSNTILNSAGIVEKNTIFGVDYGNVPNLRLRTSDNDYIDGDDNPFVEGRTFELKLTGSEWNFTDADDDYDEARKVLDLYGAWTGGTLTAEPIAEMTVSGNIATVEILQTASSTQVKDEEDNITAYRYNEIKIPLYTKVTTSSGDVKVRVTQIDSNVTNGEYTYAVAGKPGSTVYIDDDPTEYKADSYFNLPTVYIEETARGAVKSGGTILIDAPADYEWETVNDIRVLGTSNFISNIAREIVVDEETGETRQDISISSDKTTVSIRLADGNLYRANGSGRIQISGLRLSTPDDLSTGAECQITVSGADVTKTKLVVGKFVDYGLSFELDEDEEVTSLLSGRYLQNSDLSRALEDDHKTAKVVLAEDVTNSLWWDNKKITFSVPTGVKIIAADVEFDGTEVYGSQSNGEQTVLNGETLAKGGSTGSVKVEDTKVTVNRIKSDGDPVKVFLRLWVSIDAKYEGDVTITTNALEGDEATLLIAKASYPVSIERESTNVFLGIRQTAVGDIVIKETVPGAILKDGNPGSTSSDSVTDANHGGLFIEIERFGFDRIPTVEVTSGDLILETDDIDLVGDDDNILFIPIKRESSDEASTITISDVTIGDLDRTPAEGGYYVSVGGDSIINNVRDSRTNVSTQVKDTTFTTGSYKANDYIIVATPAPDSAATGTFTARVEFAIGETTYLVGSDEKSDLDVAPFIENQRTYVPVRFVAQAFGIAEEKVVWNGENREVVIDAGSRVIRLVIGSNIITINGTPKTMDVAAILRQQRTFVPIAHIAQALNVKVGWDSEGRRIIFNPTPSEESALVMQ